jgi:general secretion pathway protein I
LDLVPDGTPSSLGRRGRKYVRGESGFTLIEVLVALTILSISLAVLLEVFTQGLDRARETRNEAAARVLAQSLLAQASTEANPAMGDSRGRSNDLFWRLRVDPYGAKDDRAAWHENPAQIRATVSWRGSGGMRTITLSTLRMLPGAQNTNNNNNDSSDE